MIHKKIFLLGLLVVLSVLMMAGVNATVNIVAPANNVWSSVPYTAQNFTYNHTGAGILSNCTLLLNNSNTTGYVAVNTTELANNTNYIAKSNISFTPGANQWYVQCINATSYQDNSSISTLNYDATNPILAISVPVNGSSVNSVISINGTASDAGSGINSSTLTIQVKNSTGGCLNWSSSSWIECPAPAPGTSDWTAPGSVTLNVQNWNYTFNQSVLSSGGNYNVTARVNDNVTLGNSNTNQQTNIFTFDNTAPTISLINSTKTDGTYGAGTVINVTVTFTETVLVTGTPLLELELGTTDRNASYIAGNNSATLTFNYTVQSGDTSSDLNNTGIGALSGQVVDVATNGANLTLPAGGLAANKALVIDGTLPTVSLINSTKTDGTYGAGTVINVTVTFTETVLVTGTPLLELELGTTDRNASYIAGNNSATLTFNYTVQSGDTSSDLNNTGTSALALNSGTILDAASNAATLTLPAGGLAANKAIVVDTTAPTVSLINSTKTDGTYGAGIVINVTVTFSETVLVTGTPLLELELGTTDRNASYIAGNNSATLTFNYTVQSGDTSSDLNNTGTSALALNSGTILDAASNVATLTLPAGGLAANKALIIDATNPTATLNSINGKTATGNYTNNATLTINFTATDTNIKNWTLAVYNSTPTLVKNWTATTSNTSAVFSDYSVTANGTYNINLTVLDNASNSAVTSWNITVDTVAPSVSVSCDDTSVTVGTTVTCTCTASDALSGLASQTFTTETPSTSTAGTFTSTTCTATDNAGNSASDSESYTVTAASGGGSAGGSAGGISSGVEGQFEKKVWTSILKGETAVIEAKKDGMATTKVEFKVAETVYGAWVQVKKVEKSDLSSDVKSFANKAYQYLEVTKNEMSLKDSKITDGKIYFKVENAWLKKNSLGTNGVGLFRYNSGKWNELKTSVDKEDSTYTYYVAETPGFSYFVIGQTATAVTPEKAAEPAKETAAPAVGEPVTAAPASAKEPSAPAALVKAAAKSPMWIWIVVVLAVIVIIGVIYWSFKKK